MLCKCFEKDSNQVVGHLEKGVVTQPTWRTPNEKSTRSIKPRTCPDYRLRQQAIWHGHTAETESGPSKPGRGNRQHWPHRFITTTSAWQKRARKRQHGESNRRRQKPAVPVSGSLRLSPDCPDHPLPKTKSQLAKLTLFKTCLIFTRSTVES
jgi:hypothetical protein